MCVCVCHTKNVNTVACTNKYTHICLCVRGSPHCTSFDSTALFTCNYCRCNRKILSHLSCLCEGLHRYSTYPLSPFRDLPPSLCSWPSRIVTFKLIYFISLSLSLSLSFFTELPPSLPIRGFILTFKEYVPFNLLLFLVSQVLSM